METKDLYKSYKMVGSYEDHFEFVNQTGGKHLAIEKEDMVIRMLDYIPDYDRGILFEGLADFDIVFTYNADGLYGFKVFVFTDDEDAFRSTKELDSLACAIGIAILTLEEALYNEYQEGLA